MVLIVCWLAYVSQDIKGVKVIVAMPDKVKTNEEFTLNVQIVNERKSKSFNLGDIDLNDDFLKGFLIVSSEPTSKSSEHVPVVKVQSFTFDTAIPPGRTNTFSFKLRAVQAGLFRGDVDVYEGSRSITSMAQIQVD